MQCRHKEVVCDHSTFRNPYLEMTYRTKAKHRHKSPCGAPNLPFPVHSRNRATPPGSTAMFGIEDGEVWRLTIATLAKSRTAPVRLMEHRFPESMLLPAEHTASCGPNSVIVDSGRNRSRVAALGVVYSRRYCTEIYGCITRCSL